MLSGVSSLAVKAGAGTRRLENVELPEIMLVSRQKRTGSVELEDVTKVTFLPVLLPSITLLIIYRNRYLQYSM